MGFYTTRVKSPSLLFDSLEKAFNVAASYENKSRAQANLKDEIHTDFDVRTSAGTHIPQEFYEKAYKYAVKRSHKIMEEGLRYAQQGLPNEKTLSEFLQRLTGILEYSIAAFSNGQVWNRKYERVCFNLTLFQRAQVVIYTEVSQLKLYRNRNEELVPISKTQKNYDAILSDYKPFEVTG